jgi:hypothetical protein
VIDVYDGALAPGDTLTITFGDTQYGSPGSRAQTFRQERLAFWVLVDAFGAGNFVMIPNPPALRLTGGPAHRLRARAPSEAVVGDTFGITVVTEDRFGNPSDVYGATVALHVEGSQAPLPLPYSFSTGDRGTHKFEGLVLDKPGTYCIQVRESTGNLSTLSNPIICRAVSPAVHLYWGDIHGQSEASVGTGTLDEYFKYGRDVAALDFISHCANDFQVTNEDWAATKDAVGRFHDPERYVTFLGY